MVGLPDDRGGGALVHVAEARAGEASWTSRAGDSVSCAEEGRGGRRERQGGEARREEEFDLSNLLGRVGSVWFNPVGRALFFYRFEQDRERRSRGGRGDTGTGEMGEGGGSGREQED